jgi:uncharacterized protein (UPF0548 family)
MSSASLRILDATRWEWLPRQSDDHVYLRRWRYVPVNYARGIETDASWQVDHYEKILGADATGQLFACAADRLLHYQFYPTDLIEPASDFAKQGRVLQLGDRLVQRIHVLRLGPWCWLDFLSANEISEVIDEPRCKGFAYVTTRGHSEVGEWSAQVAWRGDDTVTLTIHAVSKFTATVPPLVRFFARRFQLYAHQRGLAAFKPATTAMKMSERR